MNFISVMAVTKEIAREQAATKTGYAPETVGRIGLVIKEGDNSRQNAFIFETTHDVTEHALYVKANLSDAVDLTDKALEDGPVLSFGRELTSGG